ncbi:MAG TPA: hypothetical protein VGL19_08465, partial [Polyangiaceae bacterium]
MTRPALLLTAAGLVIFLLWPVSACADDTRADDAREQSQAVLTYTTPQPPHYFRTTLEELAIFSAGIAQYWYDKNQNSRDWQFKYDWRSLKDRLEGKAYS